MQLSDYGWSPAMAAGLSGGTPARVTAVHKERYELVCDQGEGYGRLKAGVYFNGGGEAFPTTGDFVEIQYNPQGDSPILRTLPRRTFFSRRDPTPGRGEQAVAANFDTVFILQSLNHDFNERRLERYMTLAWQSGAVPAVVLTKADLTQEAAAARRRAERLAAGVGVFAVSAKTGEGLPALLEAVAAALPPDRRRVTLLLPFSQGALAEQCRREGAVEREEYVPDGLSMTVTLGVRLLNAVRDYIQE